MSTAPTSPTPAPHTPPRLATPSEITIFSHSGLFYWWPIWVLGFLFTLITLIENNRVIHVPSHTKVELIDGDGVKLADGPGAPAKHNESLRKMVKKYSDQASEDERRAPPRVTDDAGMGTLFLIILLVVIGITNVPMRGLWSVIIIVVIVLVSVILAVLEMWGTIFNAVGNLHIYIGMAGY